MDRKRKSEFSENKSFKINYLPIKRSSEKEWLSHNHHRFIIATNKTSPFRKQRIQGGRKKMKMKTRKIPSKQVKGKKYNKLFDFWEFDLTFESWVFEWLTQKCVLVYVVVAVYNIDYILHMYFVFILCIYTESKEEGWGWGVGKGRQERKNVRIGFSNEFIRISIRAVESFNGSGARVVCYVLTLHTKL